MAGGPVTAQGYYHFRPSDGLFSATAEHSGVVRGSSLLKLVQGSLQSAPELADARKVLSAALEHCLERSGLLWRWVRDAELDDPAANDLSSTIAKIRDALRQIARQSGCR